MNHEALDKLREPFPAKAIGKLPRISCRDCSQAQGRVCNKHQKSKCRECNNYITSAHIHLDYVGHAETTDRLLSVDPGWTWEPVSFDDYGNPMTVRDAKGFPIGMWLKLTVLGVTRYGYGSCESGKVDAVKELIGDALRNAAMRFGVALDLWAKGELESNVLESSGEARPPQPSPETNGEVSPEPSKAKSSGPPEEPQAVSSTDAPAASSPSSSEGVEAGDGGLGKQDASTAEASSETFETVAQLMAEGGKLANDLLRVASRISGKSVSRKTILELPESDLEKVVKELKQAVA